MSTKEVDVELDLDELEQQTEEQREADLVFPGIRRLGVRTTVFSLGRSPQVGTKPSPHIPDLRYAEIMHDGLQNPFVRLHWRISRIDVDRIGVVGFDIYRKKISTDKLLKKIRRNREPRPKFSPLAFDKISKGIPSYGKFSAHKKAIAQIRPSLIPKFMLNINRFNAQRAARAAYESNLGRRLRPSTVASSLNANLVSPPPILDQGTFLAAKLAQQLPTKVAHVSYSSFLAKEKKKFVSVTERDFVDMSYDDKQVRYGETFEYYIAPVYIELDKSIPSNTLEVYVENVKPASPPEQLMVKKMSTTQIRMSINIGQADDIAKAIVFRRHENDVQFKRIAVFDNAADCINFADRNVVYGQRYFYRVFLQNIYGVYSEPKLIDVYLVDQRITNRSRSNTFRNPILSVVADQNSESIKLTISPNDARVAYFEVERRNITINEKSFSVPSRSWQPARSSKIDTVPRLVGSRSFEYGGRGWTTNKLFVESARRTLEPTLQRSKDTLRRVTSQREIKFIDDTVQVDHIYQYRVTGIDLFGNKSPYMIKKLRARGKNSIRTPVNLRFVVLRDRPFRMKLMWDDDNEGTRYSLDETFEVESPADPDQLKVVYKIQRRKEGRSNYEPFPVTANNFLIDEIATADFIPFSAKKTNVNPGPTESVSPNVENVNFQAADLPAVVYQAQSQQPFSVPAAVSPIAASLSASIPTSPVVAKRPFGMPDFLDDNDVYYYRVAAIDSRGISSNFTDEFRIRVVARLSDPINVKATVFNTKVRPLYAKITWETEPLKLRPDHWVIERKIDTLTDSFTFVGEAYLAEEFFDRSIELGNSYIYRVKSIDNIGRESDFFEARLSL